MVAMEACTKEEEEGMVPTVVPFILSCRPLKKAISFAREALDAAPVFSSKDHRRAETFAGIASTISRAETPFTDSKSPFPRHSNFDDSDCVLVATPPADVVAAVAVFPTAGSADPKMAPPAVVAGGERDNPSWDSTAFRANATLWTLFVRERGGRRPEESPSNPQRHSVNLASRTPSLKEVVSAS